MKGASEIEIFCSKTQKLSFLVQTQFFNFRNMMYSRTCGMVCKMVWLFKS